MRLSFLFWNLRSSEIAERVASICAQHEVQVVILAECCLEPEALCHVLSTRTGRTFRVPFGHSSRLLILTSLPESSVAPVFDDQLGHLSVRRIVVENRTDLLLASVHFHSKLAWTDDDQFIAAGQLAQTIEKCEREYGHRRTILVGDLNMNPFEKGVIAAGALHAVMDRRIARDGTRTVNAKEYPFFYNPMWSCYGDRAIGPCGTYYYRKATPLVYFWNIFDQVLLRPDLMDSLEELRILDRDGDTSLVSDNGHPDTGVGSDHLPLYFRIIV